jgi:hypothetical protein
MLLAACADAPESPSASALASASTSAQASASATGVPAPTATPPAEPLEPSAYGVRGTVTGDGLRVREVASTDARVTDRLAAGTELRILDGPVTVDGFRWLNVAYGEEIDDRFPATQQGWMAETAMSNGEPTGDPLIEIGAPVCPPRITTPLLSGLSGYAIDRCDIQVDTIRGVVDMCLEGPLGPFIYEPSWAYFSCPFLRSRDDDVAGTGWFYQIAIPPDLDQELERGDVVTLRGRLGVDEGTYGDCVVTASEPGDIAQRLDEENQLWDLQCHRRFVVSDVEVRGHVDLPAF